MPDPRFRTVGHPRAAHRTWDSLLGMIFLLATMVVNLLGISFPLATTEVNLLEISFHSTHQVRARLTSKESRTAAQDRVATKTI